MEVPLQSSNTLRWMQVPWIKRFVAKQHPSQHCHDKLDIKLQMKANACIIWQLLKLHLVSVISSGYWRLKCAIGGCAILKLRWLLVIKFLLLFIILIYLEITCFIWFGTPIFSMPMNWNFDILGNFSCRNMILTLPSLKSHQSTSLAIQPFLNIYVHEDLYLLRCWHCVSWFQRLQWLYCRGLSVLAGWLDFLTLNTKVLHFFELILFKVGTEYPRDSQLHQHGCENLKPHTYMNILYKQEKWYRSRNGNQKHPDYFALDPQSNIADVVVTLVWLPQLFLKSRRLIWMWNLQQMPTVNIQSYLKEHGPSV